MILETAATRACSVGVLIASYRRPKDLERCLHALARQDRIPDDVIVVARDTDAATLALVSAFEALETGLPVRTVIVASAGLVAARNVGLAACRTDVVAMIDDDTVPHRNWARRISEHFAADPTLGGLGGRDRCHDGHGFDDVQAQVVGRIQWFGRLIGNHHRGFGAPRPVDFLKGANMSFRTTAIAGLRFDTRLRGAGATPHEDMAFSITVRRSGWKLIYDPLTLVDHYAAAREEPRFYVTIDKVENAASFADHAFNIVVALWDDLSPLRRLTFAAWFLLVGSGTCPGLVQAIRFMPKMGTASWQRFGIAQRGLWRAYRMLGRGGGTERRSATRPETLRDRAEPKDAQG